MSDGDPTDKSGFSKLPPSVNWCGDCDEHDTFAYVHKYEVSKNSKKSTRGLKFLQYDIENVRRIWFRVVCVNDYVNAPSSYIGNTGHIERMNVWTHLLAAVIYLTYTLIRPLTSIGKIETISSSLASFSYASLVATFMFSSVYHVYSANKWWSSAARVGDYFGIYLGISAGTLSDLSVVTINLKDVGWKSIADVWIASMLLLIFFCLRRFTLTAEETRLAYLPEKCSLGFARSTICDLEHSSLRAAAGMTLAFNWLMFIPGAFAMLENDCAWVFAGSRVLATAILVCGMVLDNAVLYPDKWFNESEAPPQTCVCYSKRGGCGS